MRTFILVALLTLAGCGKCRISSDCDEGQHCDFPTGDCLNGCMGPSDCSPVASCDRSTGRCIPNIQVPDASTSSTADAGTSTTSDAG